MSELELSARVESRNDRHVRIAVFQNGARAGTLTIDAEHCQAVLDRWNGPLKPPVAPAGEGAAKAPEIIRSALRKVCGAAEPPSVHHDIPQAARERIGGMPPAEAFHGTHAPPEGPNVMINEARSPARVAAYELIDMERDRQDQIWGHAHKRDVEWLATLVKQVGELAGVCGDSSRTTRRDLTHVCALAIKWLEERHEGRLEP